MGDPFPHSLISFWSQEAQLPFAGAACAFMSARKTSRRFLYPAGGDRCHFEEWRGRSTRSDEKSLRRLNSWRENLRKGESIGYKDGALTKNIIGISQYPFHGSLEMTLLI
jgi:hypothetical protein